MISITVSRKLKCSLLWFSSMMLLSGCPLRTRQDIATKSPAGPAYETPAEQPAQPLTENQVLRRSIADLQVQLSEVENRVNQAMGQVDILAADIKQSLETNKQAQDSEADVKWSQRFDLLKKALEDFEKNQSALQLQVASLATQVAGLQARNSKSTGTSRELGNFGQAEIDFKAKNWKEAILGYQKYRELNPSGRRFAEATLRIGMSFQAMSQKDNARLFYQEVIDKFPNTVAAKEAKAQLKKL